MITNELDIKIIRQIANNYFSSDVELERASKGLSTYVYKINHKGQTYYLRVLPEDASFAAEAKAHEIMLEQSIKVPMPIYYEHKNNLINKSLMLTSEISGCCINDGDNDIASVLYEAGKQLALINSIKVDGFSWIDRKVHDNLIGEKHSFFEYYYEKLYSEINALQQYGFDVKNIKGILDKAYSKLDTTNAFLVHGDFDNSHIYHKNGQYTGIIDFGEIRGSHYLYDLGHYKLHSEYDCFLHLTKGYNEIHKLTLEDHIKIDYLALFVGVSRSKYEHYRMLIKRLLNIINKT